MVEMTPQERQVALFLSAMLLAALALNLYFKAKPQNKDILKITEFSIKVGLNHAGEKELLRVKGIGPVTAANIVAYRNNHGPFRQLEELKQVAGVGEYRYNLVKDYLQLE